VVVPVCVYDGRCVSDCNRWHGFVTTPRTWHSRKPRLPGAAGSGN
jgi:hypothetical protein